MSTNPLETVAQFPDYHRIRPEHALPAVQRLCQEAKEAIRLQTEQGDTNTETYEKIEGINDWISKAWSPIAHLHSVTNTAEWRKAYADCQPIISQFSAEMSQHSGLYRFYCGLRDDAAFSRYAPEYQKLVTDAIRDFELSGVNLADVHKAEYQRLVQAASELYTTFSNNVLDATQAFHLHITDEAELAGIPDSAKALYRQLAEQNGVEGFWLTLDMPSYLPALTYADNRALREKLYHAFATRASELGPNAGEFDNTPVIKGILSVREDIAKLLNFDNYAELSLANKMAKSPAQVLAFLNDLVEKSRPQALREYQALQTYATDTLGMQTLEPWDVAYASEKLKQDKYAISQEQLRDYFPVSKVLTGLFDIVGKLFGVTFKQTAKLSTWHEDVVAYAVKNKDKTIAYFYMDLYARQGKNGGAWMNGAIDRINNRIKTQLPVAYLVCNFIPPTDGNPAYLSHDEVTTLFHEFGHGLHHMLTQVNCAPLSGINGVEWDAVELPSQFMENFCFEREVLINMSEHRDSKEKLPDALYDKLIRAKNFQSAMMMVRQLEFSLFDMKVHIGDAETDVMETLRAVRDEVAVTPAPAYNRFPMAFSHIFAGGYAAGYYSYKWAEVLSSDAFARFEEEGVYNKVVGTAFKKEILARGASRTAMENFVAFRGREPNIYALLRHNGISLEPTA